MSTTDAPTPEVRTRVVVVSGQGQWAYHIDGYGRDHCSVVADTIYDPTSPRLVGMLEKATFDRTPEVVWCTTVGYATPAREVRQYVEDEDEGLPRLERR